MRIAVGADHGGYVLKAGIIEYLRNKGHSLLDVGCFCPESCDYPKYGYHVAKLVGTKKADRGILVCKSGIGFSMVANKVKGVRAALCYNVAQAKTSRQHNHANVLVLGAVYTKQAEARRIIGVWLKTRPLGGRHARRIRQITAIERRS